MPGPVLTRRALHRQHRRREIAHRVSPNEGEAQHDRRSDLDPFRFHSRAARAHPRRAPPDSRRTVQLTELGDNHNKWWPVEVWDLGGGTMHMRTT